MITGLSSNDSSESLECHDWPTIRHTSTPCSQPEESTVESNGTNSMENGEHRGHPRSQQATKHSPKVSPPATPRKGMRAPKYNYAQRMRKFTGCVQSKQNLPVEWISNDNQQGLHMSNCNIEPLCVVKENSQRRIRSHVDRYD